MNNDNSRGRRELRDRSKGEARQQAADDYDGLVDGLLDPNVVGEATRAYIDLSARGRLHRKAKDSVSGGLGALAQELAEEIVGDLNVEVEIRVAGRDAALPIENHEQARQAAEQAITTRYGTLKEAAETRAREQKHTLLGTEGAQEEQTAGLRERADAAVRGQTTQDRVAQRVLEEVIEAKTTDEGLGKVGRLLDRALPESGDQCSLKVELKIPVGQTGAFVSLALEGKGARGIDGAMTAGVPVMGDPQHMEVMFQISVGGGIDVFGLNASASINLFARSGGKDTRQAMQALSYAIYRQACAISNPLANWWAGSTEGTGVGKRHKAEAWAAMIEEQAFMNAGDGAFGHVGAGGKLSVGGDIGIASFNGSIGGAGFKKFDHNAFRTGGTAENPEFQDGFAAPVADKDAATARRGALTGASGGAIGASVSVDAQIPVLGGVSFSASFSGPVASSGSAKARAKNFLKNCGLEITASLALPPGLGSSGQIAEGIIKGATSAIQKVMSLVKTAIDDDKETDGLGVGLAGADLAGDAVTVLNAGVREDLAAQLGALATGDPGLGFGSSLSIAFILGHSGDHWIIRGEIRSDKSMTLTLGAGPGSISVAATHSKRLAAIGRDGGENHAELLGQRLA